MKRFLIISLASLALLFSPVAASAQYFDHLALGAGLGLDGISLQAAAPVGDFVQLRIGGSYMPPFGYKGNIKDFQYQPGETLSLGIDARANIKSFNAMVDLFPGRQTPFHFTVGLFAGPGTLVSTILTPETEDKDWAESGIRIGDVMVLTDRDGAAKINVGVNKVLPYLGIGTGRAADKSKFVSFCFDLGVCYSGGLGLYTYGTNIKTGQEEYIRITSNDFKEHDADDRGIVDKLYGIPVVPMLKFSLFFKTF